MNQPARSTSSPLVILPCDGDPTIRVGDWLRLWNSAGGGIAHDVWVGIDGVVYENSGPGGCVRRNLLSNVLAGRQIIHIVARTAPSEFGSKLLLAEWRVGTPWAAFYNCQDFASEIATGKPQSFSATPHSLRRRYLRGCSFWAASSRHRNDAARAGHVNLTSFARSTAA